MRLKPCTPVRVEKKVDWARDRVDVTPLYAGEIVEHITLICSYAEAMAQLTG